tara:strand:+ start:177 stop:431 length:255 start_codon:yes stop_codon:yes gene_type:complete
MGLKDLLERGAEFHQERKIRRNKMNAWMMIILGILLAIGSLYPLITGNLKLAGILFLFGAGLIIIGFFVKRYAHIVKTGGVATS